MSAAQNICNILNSWNTKVGRERHVSNFIPNMPAEGGPYSGDIFRAQKHLQNVTTNNFLLRQRLYGVVISETLTGTFTLQTDRDFFFLVCY
jgi:hypothetical protein